MQSRFFFNPSMTVYGFQNGDQMWFAVLKHVKARLMQRCLQSHVIFMQSFSPVWQEGLLQTRFCQAFLKRYF